MGRFRLAHVCTIKMPHVGSCTGYFVRFSHSGHVIAVYLKFLLHCSCVAKKMAMLSEQ